LALEARKALERLLKSGPKTRKELQRDYLSSIPSDRAERKTYETKYQAFRRALESMEEDGVIAPPKYRLTGEAADQDYIRKSIQQYTATPSAAKHLMLLEDIEAECQKRDAAFTPGLLNVLKTALDDKSGQVKSLTISSLSGIASRIDEAGKNDVRLLQRLRDDYARRLVEIAKADHIGLRIAALELLLMLGTPELIPVIEQMLTESPQAFKQLKPTLTNTLPKPYDESEFLKNRFLRDQKDELRHMLIDMEEKYAYVSPTNPQNYRNLRFTRRIDLIRWHLRYGLNDIKPGENDID